MTKQSLNHYRWVVVLMLGVLAVISGNEPEVAMTDMAMAALLGWLLQPENYWLLIPPQE